jgi:hypothetical protein
MAERLSPLRAGRALSTQEDYWYSFLLEVESNPGPQCGWKDQVNLIFHLIGSRTLDLPAYNITPQSITLPLGFRLKFVRKKNEIYFA